MKLVTLCAWQPQQSYLRWDNSHLAQQPDWQAFPVWFSFQTWQIMVWTPFV
jgi:hypothetical protein